MGILTGPRINFWGGISTNVCVANNDNNIPQTNCDSDESAGETLLNVAAAQVGPAGQSMADNDIIEMMRAPAKSNSNGPCVDYYAGGGWNYYGDHMVACNKTIVSSTGSPGAMTTTGSIIDQPIYLLGSIDPVTNQGPFMSSVMVDLDPTASISTQIYIGGIVIGTPTNPILHIVENVVASSRAVFTVNSNEPPADQQAPIFRQFYRDPDGPGSAWASGTFQVTFKKENVVAWDKSDPAVAALMNAAGMDGIVLRFQMFEMFPMMTTPELVAAYDANQNPSNPSVGRVVGTLAPHFPGEPLTDSPGRELVMKGTGLVGYFEVDDSSNLMMLDALALYPKGYFRDDRKNYSSDYPIEANVDYGVNTLSAGSAKVTFDARPDDYYIYGGILDIPLDSNTAEVTGNLVSISGANTVTLPPVGDQIAVALDQNNQTSFFALERLVRIYGDPRNIYIDDEGGTYTVTLDIAVLGKPTPFFDEPGGNLIVSLTPVSTGLIADGDFLNFPSSVAVAQRATSFSFTISDNGDNSKYGFTTLVLNSDQGEGTYFINIRKYPKTDFGIAANSTITWPQVYENALRYFYVTFPGMNMRFPLNDEGTIQSNSMGIQARTSDEYRPTTLYMPITRAMTPSQRALLTQFLNGEKWQPLPGATSLSIGSEERVSEALPPYLA